MRLTFLPALGLALALAACAPPRLPPGHASGASLRFIGEQRLPHKSGYGGTTVGGLSGIDYDPASGSWLLESDDRSAVNPARYYTARLDYDGQAFRSVQLTGVHLLRQQDGKPYPGTDTVARNGGEVPDIESMRYDPRDGSIWYSSEGDRTLGFQPFVRHARADGAYLSTLATPAMFRVWPQREYGARDNVSFEGLSFAPDGRTLWLGMEAPTYQDGPLPTPQSGALSRITQLDRDGRVLAQYAYPLDPIPHAPAPGKAADNGVSEILALDGRRLYVLERAGVQQADGSYRCYVRLYEIDVQGATDVKDVEALGGARFAPARKRLVLDLNTLGLPQIDNIEGMSWGPRLANGHDTLVLVSDDNFNPGQVTQFLLFEVLP
ncbi:esterase-like activity of phytase family protein [Oxalobacteraceae bacterium A2-2]